MCSNLDFGPYRPPKSDIGLGFNFHLRTLKRKRSKHQLPFFHFIRTKKSLRVFLVERKLVQTAADNLQAIFDNTYNVCMEQRFQHDHELKKTLGTSHTTHRTQPDYHTAHITQHHIAHSSTKHKPHSTQHTAHSTLHHVASIFNSRPQHHCSICYNIL